MLTQEQTRLKNKTDASASLKEEETHILGLKSQNASDAFSMASAAFDANAKTDRYCCCHFLEAWVSVEVWKTTARPEAILCFLSVLDPSGLQGPFCFFFTEGVVKVNVALTHHRVAAPQFPETAP